MSSNPLGEFLRARRAQVRPEDVGVRVTASRRVAGLRRDELAVLAGISSEYYTRLEQGRDRHPSAQVLEALGRALRLEPSAASHLRALADGPARRRAVEEGLRPEFAAALDGWPAPAYVEGRYLDILYANPLARALFPAFGVGENLLRTAFIGRRDPGPWSEADLAALVGRLRASAGGDPDDDRLTAFVEELTLASPVFARIWRRHDVVDAPAHGELTLRHPGVGEVRLRYDKLRVVGAEDQVLVLCHPADPEATERLALLA